MLLIIRVNWPSLTVKPKKAVPLWIRNSSCVYADILMEKNSFIKTLHFGFVFRKRIFAVHDR